MPSMREKQETVCCVHLQLINFGLALQFGYYSLFFKHWLLHRKKTETVYSIFFFLCGQYLAPAPLHHEVETWPIKLCLWNPMENHKSWKITSFSLSAKMNLHDALLTFRDVSEPRKRHKSSHNEMDDEYSLQSPTQSNTFPPSLKTTIAFYSLQKTLHLAVPQILRFTNKPGRVVSNFFKKGRKTETNNQCQLAGFSKKALLLSTEMPGFMQISYFHWLFRSGLSKIRVMKPWHLAPGALEGTWNSGAR